MNLYITMHGQTNWNVQKKVQGKVDIPLNDKGKQQALLVKNELEEVPIDIIICSPLIRAKETAIIINSERNIPIIYDDRISERDFGEFEGLSQNDFDFNGFWDYYQNNVYDKAENIKHFFERIYTFLDNISETYKNKNVLIVAHGGVSIPVSCYYNGSIPKGSLVEAGLVLGNCCVANYFQKVKR